MKKPEAESVIKGPLKLFLGAVKYITVLIARSQQIIYAVIVLIGLNAAYQLTKSNYQGDFVLFETTSPNTPLSLIHI